MRHFAKKTGETIWAPLQGPGGGKAAGRGRRWEGGVMKNPNLSKATLITAGQILQEIRQQVLQNSN